MASNSGQMKPTSSSAMEKLQREPKKLEPVVYECAYSINNFGQMFPNVLLIPDITMEERYDRLIDENYNESSGWFEGQKTASPALQGKSRSTDGNFDVTIHARAYFPEPDQVKSEDEQIGVYFLVGAALNGQRKNDLADISISIVGANGTRLHTPDLQVNCSHKMFKRMVADFGLTTFVAWNQSLKDLWEKSDSFFPDGILRLKIQFGREFPQTYLGLPKSFKTMSDNWLDLLNTGDESDFTITSGTDIMEVFNVHQFILKHRSEYFKNMFSHDCVEKKERNVPMPDVKPATVRKMLEFIYGGKVEPDNLDVELLCDLIAVADKYQMSELKEICFNYLTKDIHVGNIGELAIFAETHNASHEIRKRLSDFVAENFKILRELPDFAKMLQRCTTLLCTH